MAETFAQRTRNVNAALRRTRASYRLADSKGELLERELDRLINRKTIVSPESLTKTVKLFEEYARAAANIDGALGDAIRLASSYT